MTLSPDIAQYLKGFENMVPPPPLPHVVKTLIRRERITHVKRVSSSGLCKFPLGFTGLLEVNGVWIFVGESGACYIVHSHFNAFVTGAFESQDGTMTSIHHIFHSDESFPSLALCVGNGPTTIQVKRRWGCWPAFSTADNARNFCLTNYALESLNLSNGSRLWYGRGRNAFRCIVCRAGFASKDAIMSHFSLN